MKATADADRADAIKRWGEEKSARMKGDYDLTKRLNGKVSTSAPSNLEKNIDAIKSAATSAGQTLTDPEMYKDVYGPYIDRAKEIGSDASNASKKAIGNFFNKYGSYLNDNGYHGMY